MEETRTLLAVPEDAKAHARRFGAHFDQASGEWFVVGDVPRELWNYLPKPPRRPFYEYAPKCPLCGDSMRKRSGKSGPFWACGAYVQSGCQGRMSYEGYLDLIDCGSREKRRGNEHTPSADLGADGRKQSTASPSRKNTNLQTRRREVFAKAIAVLGERQADRWLSVPKIALGNRTPYEVMTTVTGCNAVVRLLNEVWK